MSENTEKRREKGTGNIYKRSNGSWVGRLNIGRKSDGSPKIKCFSGKTEAEVKRKIREYIRENSAPSNEDKKKISVGTYLNEWLKTYKKGYIRQSSYDRLENTIIHQIVPEIGFLQLHQLNPMDIQKMLSKLKDKGLSHSTVKKVYDCLHAALNHAFLNGDIERNPILLVKPPEKKLFPTKEIRFFTEKEVSLIIEECRRKYSTGSPVYIYGEAFILMLNTGLRVGEVIALERADWNKEEKTLTIKKNAQAVKSRDSDGERTKGYEIIINPTKTYSGERVIPLNQRASDAIELLCNSNPESRYILSSSKGGMVPPDRLERTFYRVLNNAGISKTGTHSLRHTFASTLFSKGVDIKTVSQLLGHASIQITLNTYVHLIEGVDHEAVKKLDNLF